MSKVNQLTIGLAGHIDHGKTSLVKCLTGKNTDSLSEEIKRGMTINIGFAHLNNSISLIDVPGHEKFIKNMVSGVCFIDFVVLVIAADDGIMPQTIEHYEILKLLNIKKGIIVINKIDLVDKEWLDLVRKDIEIFFKNTFLNNVPIFETSTIENIGIEKLKKYILELDLKSEKFDRGVFRMFVDRVFSKKGFGDVVTGTVTSGFAETGDKIKILPFDKVAKIRGLHSHDKSVNEIKNRDRAAINLHYLDKFKIFRGCHLSCLDHFDIADSAIVKLNVLSKGKNKINHNKRIRFHLGTQEVMGRLLLIDDKEIEEKSIAAIIKFEKKIIATFKDNFIIRSYSPITTIGGGIILDNNIKGKWKNIKLYARKLFNSSDDDQSLIYSIISENSNKPYKLDEICKKTGLSSTNLLGYVKHNKKIDLYGAMENPWLISFNQLNDIYIDIIERIRKYHENNKYSNGIRKDEINHYLKFDLNLLDVILSNLIKLNKIGISKDIYFLKNFQIDLNQKEKELTKQIIDTLHNKGFNTPNTLELADELQCSEKKIIDLLKIEQNNKNIIVINNGSIIFTRRNYEKLLDKISKYFSSNNSLSIKDFKNLSNTTRKYAVPLIEYLDKEKITIRIGNEREQYK